MDEFILRNQLKWIPYDRFKNVEYLDKGGFGTIYKAILLNEEIILKGYNNLIADPHVIDRIYIVKCGVMLINKKNAV
jgi:hypothetical protein